MGFEPRIWVMMDLTAIIMTPSMVTDKVLCGLICKHVRGWEERGEDWGRGRRNGGEGGGLEGHLRTSCKLETAGISGN